jgi:hypothetical protein
MHLLNNMIKELPEEDVTKTWVTEATENDGISDEVADEAIRKRFGNKVVIFDPTDLQANKTAISKGYRVIHGRDLTKDQWIIVKRTKMFVRAGVLFPTPTPKSSPHVPETRVSVDQYTPEIQATVAYTKRIGELLLNRSISVDVHRVNNGFSAWYGGGTLSFNLSRLGYKWFKLQPDQSINDLIIHELGHEYCLDHLDSRYYQALSRLGAQMVKLALEQPELFDGTAE